MSSLGRAVRALPTMLRVGIAETVAYRAEFLVWVLTTTLPLVMLSLWSTVATEAPFAGYRAPDFVAYYLANLIVRQLTGSWVGWQVSEEIRSGTMAMRLLRPIHPFVAIACTHLAAVPLRSLIALPIAIALLASSGASALTSDPAQLGFVVVSLGLAWLLSFAMLFALGSAAFFLTKSMALMTLYFGLFSLLSGYLMPIALMPGWLRELALWSPFRYTLSAPIELLVRPVATADALGLLARQAAWTGVMVGFAMLVWRRGLRRFEAVGS